jgi:hypothetical protein
MKFKKKIKMRSLDHGSHGLMNGLKMFKIPRKTLNVGHRMGIICNLKFLNQLNMSLTLTTFLSQLQKRDKKNDATLFQ